MGYLFGTKSDLDLKPDAVPAVMSDRLRSAEPRSLTGPTVSPLGLDHYRGLPAFGLLQHAAEALPDRLAVSYCDAHWTYRQLNHDAVRCAAMLQAQGVRPGDRVGILLPNVPEFVIAANAIWRAGGVVVALSPLMVADEIESLLKATQCRHVVCLDVLAHLLPLNAGDLARTWLVSIRKHLPAHHQIGYVWMRHSRTGQWTSRCDDLCQPFWHAISETSQRWRPISIDPETEPAYLLPTGGTTGSSKTVTLSHQNMVANAWQQYAHTQRSFGSESMLAVLPFFHSYGVSAMMMSGAMMGASLILHHRFNARQVIQSIETHRPTVLHAVPAMLVALNERLRVRPADLSSIKWVISGGAPLEESIAREFSRYSNAAVVEGFGLSEASPVTHVGDLFGEPCFGTIGKPLPETECRIVDALTGAGELGNGEVGELVVRGPQVMLGYWNQPAATKETIRDGWLFTGDLATRDAAGLYRIVGRKKDLIITSGFNVYPVEVEEILRQAEGVLDAAVVGQPDPRRGEVVKAFVVLKPGCAWDEDRLREHCRRTLAAHKRPQLFEHCVGDLPRNFLGKVVRRHLRESPTTLTPAESSATEVNHVQETK